MRRTIKVSLALLPFILVLGWAAAVVALAGGGCHGGEGAAAAEGTATVVKIDGCTFAPTVTRVAVGTEVQFLNTSPQIHDVTGQNGEWRSDALQSGQASRVSFREGRHLSVLVQPSSGDGRRRGRRRPIGANDAVDSAPVSATVPAAPTSAGDSTLPILAAGGFGILAGALVAGAVVSRRRPTD